MEYRQIRTDEVPLWRQFQEYCFNVPHGEFDPYMAHKFTTDPVRGLFDNQGRLLACLTNFRYSVYIEGARIGMGGIAGVASPPEYRRGGHVADMLRACIRETRAQGMPLSSLYPFKQAFYRRYGWEVASAWLTPVIPIDQLSRYRGAPGLVQRFPAAEEDWRDLAAIYDRWAPAKRGYMVRPDAQFWQDWVNASWREPQHRWHAALWRPAVDAPAEGYLLYRFDKHEGKNRMAIKELIPLTRAAELGLWGFVAQHDSQVKDVMLRVPRDYPLWSLVDNTYDVKTELNSGWMLRIIDVKDAFEARPWPSDLSGALTLDFTDELAPWNQGTWKLTFDGGHATVERARAETATLSGTVQTWSQLYAGFVRPEQAVATERLRATDPRALRLLSAALHGDSLFFYEYF